MVSLKYFVHLLVHFSSALLLVDRIKGNGIAVEDGMRITFNERYYNFSHEQRLYRSLFTGYNKHLRPLKDPNKAIKVFINPSISGIIKADELDQSLKFFQWFPMIWKDEFLEWNPSQFGGLQYILVPSQLIWIPDIFAFTTMESKEVLPLEKTYARVDHAGNVNLIKHQFLTVRCQYYILLFPFDVQQCRMPFGSWAYTTDQVEVDAFESRLAQQIFEENSEWEIISFSSKKETVVYESFSAPVVNRTFQEIHYDLVFKRKPTFYIYMIVVPCSIIVNICLLGLFAPFNTNGDRQEKLTLGLTTLLTVAVLLHIVTGEMPKSAEGLPLLGKFILWELVVCATAVAVSVLLMYGHRQMIKSRRLPPKCMRRYKGNHMRRKSMRENYGMVRHLLAKMAETQLHYSDIYSEPKSHENEIYMSTLNSCVGDITALKKQLMEIQDDISLHELWNIAFERIDLIFLVIFLSVNVLLTYIIFVFIPGP